MSVRSTAMALDVRGVEPLGRLILLVLADHGDSGVLNFQSISSACEVTPQEAGRAVIGLEDQGHILVLSKPGQWPSYVLFPTEVDFELAEAWKRKRPGARPAIPLQMRRLVFDRDGHLCGYCGTRKGPFHLDHVVPVSRGGETTPENLMVSCAACNIKKRDKTPEEWIGG